jgi:HPt (histidine-containing phosphotransfer) domain-containing protein
VLNKFIRDKQKPEVIAAARSERKRVRLTEEPSTMSKEFISLFLRDAGKSYGVLNGIYARRTSVTAPDIQNYIIHIHAVKSALANIGEKDLSRQAAMLEEWCRNGNYDGVFNETPEFLNRLREIMERLSDHVTPSEEVKPAEEVNDDNAITGDTLAAWEALRDACYSYEKKAAKEVLSQLKGLVKGANQKKVLDDITTQLLHSSFDEAGEAADEVIRAITA